MAKISSYGRNGKCRRITGNWGTIYLGPSNDRQANAFRIKLRELESAKRLNQLLSDEVQAWLVALPDETHAKIASVGLVSARQSNQLKQYLQTYLAGRTD